MNLKFWKRPEPIREMVPTVFLRGEEIVEVGFSEWQSRDGGGSWNMVGRADIPIPTEAERIVFELPTGCFEYEAPLSPGLISMGPNVEEGNPLTLQRCYRFRALQETEEEARSGPR